MTVRKSHPGGGDSPPSGLMWVSAPSTVTRYRVMKPVLENVRSKKPLTPRPEVRTPSHDSFAAGEVWVARKDDSPRRSMTWLSRS